MEQQRENRNQSENADRDKLPVAINEDVEFSQQLADEEDLEAQARAQAADSRAITNSLPDSEGR